LIVTVLLLSSAPVEAQGGESLAQTFSREGWLSGLAVVFGFGLLLNLTPCVYPMVPITVGYFGNRETDGWRARFVDAGLYLLGMVLIYTLLGAMAGLTGQMLGQALQSPLVQGTLALLMVLMAASMFGLFELSFSENLERNLRKTADGLGTFGMGMTLGVAAAPCLAPSTVALLGYIGQSGSMLTGSVLFLVLSLGLGLPYVILAVSSGLLDYLPKSGNWFEWVETLIGYVLIGVALYFLLPLLPMDYLGGLVIVWLVAAMVSLILRVPPANRWIWSLRTLALVAVAGLGIYWILFNFIWLAPRLDWTKGTNFVEEAPVKKPAVVYTGADWCVPCQEMKVTTFQANRVVRAAQEIEMVKMDLSDPPPEPIETWLSNHDMVGVPTMFFLQPGGEEVRELRGEGYLNARQLANRLEKLRSASGSSFL
jgi:thiol:disulfide interchange protein DsbD